MNSLEANGAFFGRMDRIEHGGMLWNGEKCGMDWNRV